MDSEGLSQSSLLYRLTDRLPVRTVFLVAIQHVLAMFVGVITVPLPDGAGRKTAKVISMDDAVELTAFDDGPARRTLNEVRK